MDKSSIDSPPWKNFDQAKEAFRKIDLGKTTLIDLEKLGFDPKKVPNTEEILNIKRDLLPSPNATADDLEPGAAICYRLGSRCKGLKFDVGVTENEGTGNSFLWLLGFKKERTIVGWKYVAKIYHARLGDIYKAVTDPAEADKRVVIFALEGGKRRIEGVHKKDTPLGPAQYILDIGGMFSPVKPRINIEE